MAILNQEITERYALYNGDCMEVMRGLPDASIHLSIYSPPFGGLYCYSSDPLDMSNCRSYEEFFEHYNFVVPEIQRITMPGRLSCVHVADVPGKHGDLVDFPGDVIRLHEKHGFRYHARFAIWKEPLRVAIRTRSKGLTHRMIVKDASWCNNAGADYLLVFRNKGENKIPIKHPLGLSDYKGEREIPAELLTKWADCKDPQKNKLAHWIWQQYASSFWDDIRINRVLPYKAARDPEDEKHCHPLQLDVIDRCVHLWSNEGERVFTPYMGVGSECYSAVQAKRFGIGAELKPSYWRQAFKNVAMALQPAVKIAELQFEDETEPEMAEA